MSAAFLFASLLWGALAAGLAEALTRANVTPVFAQTVWRVAAAFMVLPWIGLALSPLFRATPLILPGFEGLAEFGPSNGALNTTLASLPLKPNADLDFAGLLLAMLVTGWVVRAVAIGVSHARLGALRSASTPLVSPRLTHEAQTWASALGLAHAPTLATIPGNRSPFVAGIFHRTLYLPAHLKDAPSTGLILAHECVHIARGDLITRPIERAIADLLWFSPFAWLARARLDYFREAVCDAQTVALTNAPVAYARALTEIARTTRKTAPLPAAALILPSKRKTLPMRISAILTPAKPSGRARTSLGLAAALIAAPLAIAQGLATPGTTAPQVFSAPVVTHADAKITSAFGERPDPFNAGKKKVHLGVDIGVPIGARISTPGGGTVVFAGKKSEAYGNVVDIQLTQSGDVMRFSQLSEVSVQTGDTLLAGTQIGLAGKSGRATGPHLHMEYMRPDMTGEAGKVTHEDPASIEGLTLIGQS